MTCSIVAGVGPNSPRTPSESGNGGSPGDFGSDTSCASAANAAGSRGLSVDGQRERRRSRSRPDERGPGGNKALVAGESLAPGSGGPGARRGGGAEGHRAGEHHAARADTSRRGAADQPHVDTPSSVRPHRCPRAGKGNAPTRAIFRARLLLGTRSRAFPQSVVQFVVGSRVSGLRRSAPALKQDLGLASRPATTRHLGQRTTLPARMAHLGGAWEMCGRSGPATKAAKRAEGRLGRQNLRHGTPVPPPLRPGSHHASYRVSTR